MSANHYLVIGGTRGIGKHLVNMLIADESNNVSNFGRSPDIEQRAFNLKHYAADVSDHALIFAHINSAVSHFGKISTVVFMQRHRSKNDEMDLDINIGVHSTKAIIDFMVTHNLFNEAHTAKSIVVVSSIADQYIAEEQPAGYHVAKAGLVQLARYYALKLGNLGIRVNAVSPCVVAKPEAKEFYQKNQPLVDRFRKFIPLGRMGDPADIANAVIFLASSKASYITGQNIVVDGGLTLRSHESLIRDIT